MKDQHMAFWARFRKKPKVEVINAPSGSMSDAPTASGGASAMSGTGEEMGCSMSNASTVPGGASAVSGIGEEMGCNMSDASTVPGGASAVLGIGEEMGGSSDASTLEMGPKYSYYAGWVFCSVGRWGRDGRQ